MPIKVTSLLIDALTRASEKPEPVALERNLSGVPLAPSVFPPDWSAEIRLESRWQTDVTRPQTGSKPEKWALFSRPSRRLTVRLVGAGKDEANALLQAALGYTSLLGVPVPIYCDATPVQALGIATINGTPFNRIDGDFTCRRFFVGGRVAFYPLRVRPKKTDNSTLFATILELNPSSMIVSMDSSTVRSISLEDVVAPCMDVELTQAVQTSSRHDELLEVTVSWEELDGACSLPASWPPTDSTNPELLSPICQIVDSYPVFPFDPNWKDGVSIEAVRDIDSTGSGRSSIQEPRGDSYLRFSLSIMGYDRRRAWDVIRFFDSMQGRAGDFYLVHPLRPLRLDSIPSVSTVRLVPDGDLERLKAHYKRLAFFRQDGTIVTRKISAATFTLNTFQITLDADLPDTNFVEVQPIHVCSFDQDSLEEAWATDHVIPSMSLVIREEPNPGPVNVPNISFAPGTPAFLKIPGCNLLLRAGSGCLDAQSEQSLTWPGRGSQVDVWRDVSSGSNRSFGPPSFNKELRRVTSPKTSRLVRFPQQFQNNGQPSMLDPRMELSYQLDSAIPVGQRHLWSDSGWTLFLCFTPEPHAAPASQRTIVDVRNDSYNIFFHIDYPGQSGAGRACWRYQFSSGVGAGTLVPLTVDISTLEFPVVLTLRLHRSGSGATGTGRCWVNGQQATATAGGSPFDFGMPTSYSVSDWWAAFNRSATVSATVVAQRFGLYGCANLIASYNRPLDIGEINEIQAMIGDMYRTSVVSSTLY